MGSCLDVINVLCHCANLFVIAGEANFAHSDIHLTMRRNHGTCENDVDDVDNDDDKVNTDEGNNHSPGWPFSQHFVMTCSIRAKLPNCISSVS